MPTSSRRRLGLTDTVLARLAALKTMPIPQLKQQWRDLFETEPPPYNRRFLESRLAYRIQELAYGGLKPETVEAARRARPKSSTAVIRRAAASHHQDRPIAGTRLIREWQGVEHCVTVRDDDFEYQGRPLQIALGHRARHHRHALERLALLRPQEPARHAMKKPVVRKLRCAVYTRKSSEEGLDRSSTRSMPSARPARPISPARRPRAGCSCPTATTTAASPAARWSARR